MAVAVAIAAVAECVAVQGLERLPMVEEDGDDGGEGDGAPIVIVVTTALVITGEDIRRWRLRMGWSLADLAHRLNYTRQGIAFWERGAKRVPRDQYQRILMVFSEASLERQRIRDLQAHLEATLRILDSHDPTTPE